MFLDLRACIYKKNKLNWIKEQRHALQLDTLFLTKKKILYIKSFRTKNFWIRRHKTINREKAKNIFRSRFYAFFVRYKRK